MAGAVLALYAASSMKRSPRRSPKASVCKAGAPAPRPVKARRVKKAPDQAATKEPAQTEPVNKGAVKPAIDRMQEMHEAMAHDREQAKKNPAYRFKTQQGWADHFGLKSKKTIQRDCDYMRDRLNLPVYPIRARGGLGYTEEVGAFPLVSFSRGALVAICAAWRALEAYRGTSFEAEIEPTMKKLLGGLGMELTDYLERVLKRISFRSAGFQARMNPDIFETVTQAVLDETELEFRYLKLEEARLGKAPSTRRIRPRDLVSIGGAWYIFGEDLDRKLEIREFALCRMSAATNTGEVFTPTTPFDLQAALKKCFGAHVSGTPEKVRVEFDAATAPLVDERDWHE